MSKKGRKTSPKQTAKSLGPVARIRTIPTPIPAQPSEAVVPPSKGGGPATKVVAAEPGGGGSTESAGRISFFAKLDEIADPDAIVEAGRRLGVIERQRKVELPILVRATITALSPMPGTETSIFVNYLSMGGTPVVPSAFYDRFTDEYAVLLKELAERTIVAVRDVAPADRSLGDFGVLLEHFRDIRLADSTCHLLKRLAKGWAPSTSKKRPAGFKFHEMISLRDGLPVAGDVTPQRTHDNRAFPAETLEAGTLHLFDLGYIDVGRFIDAIDRGAHFLTRLKTSHDPEIVRVHAGTGSRLAVRGMRLDAALAANLLDSKNGVIDLDVRLRSGSKEALARVVAVEDSIGERHWYITTVPREILSPCEVADTYRLRWEIELHFKQMKSGAGFKAILAWRPSAVLALLYAKVVAMALARLLELAVEEKHGPHATKQLALMLTLSRSTPLLMTYFMHQSGVTLQQLEDRLLLIASIVAKSRNQRRERAKRARQESIGRR